MRLRNISAVNGLGLQRIWGKDLGDVNYTVATEIEGKETLRATKSWAL